MHVFGAANDGVDRTRLDTFGAANAIGFHYQGDGRRQLLAARPVISQRLALQRMGQSPRAFISAWWAAVGIGFVARHRFGVGPAPVKAALAALGLRQQSIKSISECDGHEACHANPGQRTGIPGSAATSASSSARLPPSNPADRIIPSLVPKRILRGARLAMKTTLRPTSVSGSP